jgi:hypothetical protein
MRLRMRGQANDAIYFRITTNNNNNTTHFFLDRVCALLHKI